MASTSVVNSTRIELLTKQNYDTWTIQVEALLVKRLVAIRQRRHTKTRYKRHRRNTRCISSRKHLDYPGPGEIRFNPIDEPGTAQASPELRNIKRSVG